MDIIQVVNTYWPNTIAKLALDQQHLPDGLPFMGAYVHLFDGATLPAEAEVTAKAADYDAFVATQKTNSDIRTQIAALEATQTDRRVREAFKDPTWINALDAQIVTLRAQLK